MDRPYTYSYDLVKFMSSLNSYKFESNLRVSTLCKSLLGIDCKLLVITEDVDRVMSYSEMVSARKKT